MAERQVASRQIQVTETTTPKYQPASDDSFANFVESCESVETPTTKGSYDEDDLDVLDNNEAKNLPLRKESDDATKRLVAYIEEKMEYFDNKLTFAAAGINPPTPYEIQQAFSTWTQTSFSLNSMYEFAQTDADNAEAELKHFLQIKKSEVRKQYNKIDMKKSAWLSSTEIEATVYSIYRNDIAKLEAKSIELRREASYLNSMKKSWSDYLWVLRSLKEMSIAEMQGMKYTPDLRRGDETDLM